MKSPCRNDIGQKAPPVNFRTTEPARISRAFLASASNGDAMVRILSWTQNHDQNSDSVQLWSNQCSLPAAGQDPEAWKQAVQTARIAYEAERIRSDLLELEKDGLGSPANVEGLQRTIESESRRFAAGSIDTKAVGRRY
jgi:hypothetical protein